MKILGLIRLFLMLGLLFVACAGSSCMSTTSLSGEIRESQSAAREFAPAKQIKGRYLGTRRIGAIDYHHYVFPGALVNHSQRELVILIPLDRFRRSLGDNNPHAIVRESPPVGGRGRQAVLYLNPTDFDSPYPGQDQALRWPRGTSPNTNKHVGVVALWMPFSGDERTIIIAQAAPEVSKSNESFNSYFLDIDLKYVARSRANIGVKSLGFLGTIPLDVVTFPCQALVLAAFSQGP